MGGSGIQVAIHTLWNIRIIVLAKPEHENRISHVLSDSVKTGIANTLGTSAVAVTSENLISVTEKKSMSCVLKETKGQWGCHSCSTGLPLGLSTVT